MEFFKITNSPVAVSIENADIPDFPEYHQDDASKNPESNNTIYFEPQSLNSLDGHFSWGKNNDCNVVEQGGILIGEVFSDKRTDNVWGIVYDVIPAKNAPSNKTHLCLTTDVWIDMYTELDNKYQNMDKPHKIIGWYHTHPNNLDVFMSPVDVATQKKFFKEDWQFSVVFNPHRKIWKAFCGEECKECRGVFLLDVSFYETEFNPKSQHNKNVYPCDEINKNNNTSNSCQDERYINPENDKSSCLKKFLNFIQQSLNTIISIVPL